ncbi:MAG: hypothetical protein L0H37_06765, partial [Nitrosospira sp.]|nr:hypothetical protein [Nitrosospira sp.]
SPAERKQMDDLGKEGKRLIGFCRTNLFKRLESSGFSFLQSIERHILRNEIYLHAIDNGLELPIGTLDAGILDADRFDEDAEGLYGEQEDLLDGVFEEADASDVATQAATIYRQYVSEYRKRFKWIGPRLFKKDLYEHLADDVAALRGLLNRYGLWKTEQDRKLVQLEALIARTHGNDKVLVFTQFADTARYLGRALQVRGIRSLAVVTGASADPYAVACCFSPHSNRAKIAKADELRVLVCTDVLSEGQNLQDCAVVVNFDLPWAIIRLIQRAGRVDRIGQQAEEILCYSFLPADGVERLIKLRARIAQRLQENAEVVGTDEAFFEDEDAERLRKLSLQTAGSLDDQDDEVDLASYAWQIWKSATESNPALAREIEALPPVIFSAKRFPSSDFLQVLDFVPEVYGADGILRAPTEFKPLRFATPEQASLVLCVLNSSLFRWYIQVFTDCRHVNKREVDNFPLVKDLALHLDDCWIFLAKTLSESLRANSEFRSMKFAHDHLQVQCIIPKRSKSVIDEIEAALGRHFGLTQGQLDYIINYDIKYRMGQGADTND